MDDALLMRCVQPIHNLNGEIEQFAEFQRRFPWTGCKDQFPERLAFEQLHYEEGLSLVLTEFVDGADVGMFQR